MMWNRAGEALGTSAGIYAPDVGDGEVMCYQFFCRLRPLKLTAFSGSIQRAFSLLYDFLACSLVPVGHVHSHARGLSVTVVSWISTLCSFVFPAIRSPSRSVTSIPKRLRALSTADFVR